MLPASKRVRGLFLVIFSISLLLRLTLASINRDANDAHLEVTQIILETGKLPTWNNCWECFQPKLYHLTLATIFYLTKTNDLNQQIVIANLVSFLAGAITLALIGLFLLRLPFSPSHSLLAFAFVAFNPKFIAISAQATNDSLHILFSTSALFLFSKFVLRNTILHFALGILFVALAISIKSSGIVTFMSILMVFVLQIILEPTSTRRIRLESLALIYLIAVLTLVIINPLNQYISNSRQFGSPLLLNIGRQPLPHFIQRTFIPNPGILSIEDGFLTFKLIDLLAHPRIEDSISGHFQHRTSLWTQLYARAHSLNFDNWPPLWSTNDESLFPLLRAIYLLALLPTVLVLWGVFLQLRQLTRSIWHRDLSAASNMLFGLFPITFCGYIAFVILYALLYREFSVMKAIFILPALPAVPLAFLVAIDNRPRWFYYLLFSISLPLLFLYVADVVSLILRLS